MVTETSAPPEVTARPGGRAVASWCLYDWANSAFTTLVVTFIYSTYFSGAFGRDPAHGTVLWSRAIVTSAVIIAVLSPVLGAQADRSGHRRRYLLTATLVCCAATAGLAFIAPAGRGAAVAAILVFIVANVAFEVAMVFYNSFLPAIVAPGRIGRVSGWGWALGYAGGLTAMAVALFGFVRPETPWFGLPAEGDFRFRATNLLVAGWFLAFSLPMFLFVPEGAAAPGEAGVRGAFRELGRTIRSLGRYREVAKFLVARLVYNDGLVTVIAFGGIYAAGTFGMGLDEVIFFGMMLNIAAGLGAWAFGFVDDRLGGRRTILISLVALALAVMIAVAAPSRLWLWVAGGIIGVFLGPNQAASRSLMGRFTPERHRSEFFGFFAFSGKITSFMGPLLLGVVTGVGGQRLGVATVLLFFAVGAALLWTVDEAAGIAAAGGPPAAQA
ncbi:MAG: MFS transporter [Gemmatimonadota bacterium]|nr:MFS transporter [Gemmatimonadota bacterium]